jgi:hypothetical protein
LQTSNRAAHGVCTSEKPVNRENILLYLRYPVPAYLSSAFLALGPVISRIITGGKRAGSRQHAVVEGNTVSLGGGRVRGDGEPLSELVAQFQEALPQGSPVFGMEGSPAKTFSIVGVNPSQGQVGVRSEAVVLEHTSNYTFGPTSYRLSGKRHDAQRFQTFHQFSAWLRRGG